MLQILGAWFQFSSEKNKLESIYTKNVNADVYSMEMIRLLAVNKFGSTMLDFWPTIPIRLGAHMQFLVGQPFSCLSDYHRII
jgi:hypothetical protein